MTKKEKASKSVNQPKKDIEEDKKEESTKKQKKNKLYGNLAYIAYNQKQLRRSGPILKFLVSCIYDEFRFCSIIAKLTNRFYLKNTSLN